MFKRDPMLRTVIKEKMEGKDTRRRPIDSWMVPRVLGMSGPGSNWGLVGTSANIMAPGTSPG